MVATTTRNPRRGDPCSAHEFLVDALQGCFYENDECLLTGAFLEESNRKGDGFLLFLRALPGYGWARWFDRSFT